MFKALPLLLLLCRAATAAQWGADAAVAQPLAGPLRAALAPGAAVSVQRPLGGGWAGGLSLGQFTAFEDGYYVSARHLDLRLRRLAALRSGLLAWAEAGVGLNFMAWHYSNWPGWTHGALEAGLQWPRERGPAWELGLGLQGWGPPESALWLGTLRLGLRWGS